MLAIVMEFVAWGNLARWAVSRRGEVSEEVTLQRVRIANGVASGMAFIHSKGCVRHYWGFLVLFLGLQGS